MDAMPNSILWIGLVVLWLFVLFPMLAGRHPRIRQTTDAALATRVLHRGGTKRKRAHRKSRAGRRTAADDSETERAPAEDGMGEAGVEGVELDTAYLSSEGHGYSFEEKFVPDRRGRGRFDPDTDARARTRRYVFRQRAALTLLLTALGCGVGGFIVTVMWWGSASAVGMLACYLVYLRRQVRLEQEIRRRRLARLIHADREYRERDDRFNEYEQPALSAVVVEPDDEDPVFDHLTTYDSYLAAHADQPEPVRRVVGE